MPTDMTAERLRGLLTHYARLYPTAWREAERFRLARAALGNWPDWCWVPMAGAHATVSNQAERAPFPVPAQVVAYDTAVLSALIAWRLGQGVYRFDPELLAALWETPVSGDLPGELLFRLPEYGVYIEAPADTWHGARRLLGAFAHLEWDVNRRHAELRLLLDVGTPTDMVVLPVHLGGTLEDGLREALRHTTTLNLPPDAARAARDLTREDIDAGARWLAFLAQPVVSCLLYLCSEGAEYAGDSAPRPAQAGGRRGREDWRPPAQATVWEVGVRMGAALRRARQETGGTEEGVATGRQVRSPEAGAAGDRRDRRGCGHRAAGPASFATRTLAYFPDWPPRRRAAACAALAAAHPGQPGSGRRAPGGDPPGKGHALTLDSLIICVYN